MTDFKVQTDTYFTIGYKHSKCEDYALCGPDFIVLSDGCSQVEDTNIGSMLLCHAARQVLKIGQDKIGWRSTMISILHKAMSLARTLDYSEQVLHATLLLAQRRGKWVNVAISGDGVVALRRASDQMWEVHMYEYPANMPYYLVYELNEDHKRQVFESNGHHFIHHLWETHDKAIGDVSIEQIPTGPVDPIVSPQIKTFSVDMEEYDCVLLASDGVSSFNRLILTETQKYRADVTPQEVMAELLLFKRFNGNFVTRRCKWALEQWTLDDWQHVDDFSVAAMHWGKAT